MHEFRSIDKSTNSPYYERFFSEKDGQGQTFDLDNTSKKSLTSAVDYVKTNVEMLENIKNSDNELKYLLEDYGRDRKI